jgi:pyruvate formate lyase activating enzyme
MKLSKELNSALYRNTTTKERQRSYLPKIDGTHGLIYNIQRYSIHDGPGIRTTIFLKGCPLRCRWCQNPESIKNFPEVGYSEPKCVRDYACVKSCTRKAIKIGREGYPIHIDRRLCRGCKEHNCIDTCYNKALRLVGEILSVEYVINEIKRDTIFYRNSNGGVTLSGGEPLHQPLFTLNLLRSCKERGFHTVLDTSGYAEWDILREIVHFVDLVLYDIKCFDSQHHLTLTGVPNETILQNLRSLVSETDTSVIARIPVIPGLNDSEENITDTAQFLKDSGLKEVNLLPYHKLGIGKYKAVGKRYLSKKTEAPSDEQINHLKELIKTYGLRCDAY